MAKGDKIEFKDGYKYQLFKDYAIQTKIYPAQNVTNGYVDLNVNGVLVIHKGYAWDGCSGPTIDRACSFRAGLVHDSGYSLLREGLIPPSFRGIVDKLFHEILLEDGMSRPMAWMYYQAVSKFASFAASPRSNKPPRIAP